MPNGEPVNLTVAVIVAVLGAIFGLVIVVRFALDHRRRKRLLAEQPDMSAHDADVQRYVRRCWLMYAGWREQLATTEPLDAHWASMLAAVEQLRSKREAGEDSTAEVAALVELEQDLERLIDELRG